MTVLSRFIGKSMNLPAAQSHAVTVERDLRMQVSSGAHPRYARNPGSGEPLRTATTLKTADQQVYHDPEHPSAVVLPVTSPR